MRKTQRFPANHYGFVKYLGVRIVIEQSLERNRSRTLDLIDQTSKFAMILAGLQNIPFYVRRKVQDDIGDLDEPQRQRLRRDRKAGLRILSVRYSDYLATFILQQEHLISALEDVK